MMKWRSSTTRLKSALRRQAPADVLCVEIGAGAAKLAVARHSAGRRAFETVRELPLETGDEDDLRAALRELLNDHAAAGHDVVLALTRPDVLVRRKVFPTHDPREVDAMVPFQATALLPLPAREFVIQHRLLDTTPEGASNVAIMAVPRRLIESRVRMLEECGFAVKSVRLSTELQDADAPAATALGNGTVALEFLPPDAIARQRAEAGRRRFAKTTGLALYCLLMLTIIAGHRVHVQQERLDATYAYLASTEAAARRLDEMQAASSRVAAQLDGASALERLREVCAVAPAGVTLSEFSVNREDATVVRGLATSTDRALDFVESLRNSDLFATAVLQFAGSQSGDERKTDFEIRATHRMRATRRGG